MKPLGEMFGRKPAVPEAPDPELTRRALEAAGLIAPDGTNKFLMDHNGVFIKTPTDEIEVGMEDCGERGLCTEIFRETVDPVTGDEMELHAHVREDDSMEFGFAVKYVGGDRYKQEDLDFKEQLELARQKLTEHQASKSSPTPSQK